MFRHFRFDKNFIAILALDLSRFTLFIFMLLHLRFMKFFVALLALDEMIFFYMFKVSRLVYDLRAELAFQLEILYF